MAELFRLVKWYNFPRWLIIIIHCLIWIWMIWIKIRYLKREMVKYHVVSIMCIMCWCFGTMEFHDFPGISSSQLTICPSCFTGVGGSTTNQKNIWDMSMKMSCESLLLKGFTLWILGGVLGEFGLDKLNELKYKQTNGFQVPRISRLCRICPYYQRFISPVLPSVWELNLNLSLLHRPVIFHTERSGETASVCERRISAPSSWCLFRMTRQASSPPKGDLLDATDENRSRWSSNWLNSICFCCYRMKKMEYLHVLFFYGVSKIHHENVLEKLKGCAKKL